MKLLGGILCIIVLLSIYRVDGQPSSCPEPECTWNYFMPSTWPTVCGGRYALCGDGERQSPINVDTSLVETSLDLANSPLHIHYEEVHHTTVVNLGTTIHVDIGANNTVYGGPLGNDRLFLNQLHFHAPGEHQINGVPSSAEVHLVHQSLTTKRRAVVVVRVMTGTANPWFDNIFTVRNLPVGANTTIDINPLQLFPLTILDNPYHLAHSNYYYYNGSLTTPPCTEGIYWMILIDPIFASVSQIQDLQRWEGINNRPIQQYNGTVYRPHFSIVTPSNEGEDIRHMGMVIGISFLLGLVAFFAIIAIAIIALHIRDSHDKRDFYGAQQFELQPTNY